VELIQPVIREFYVVSAPEELHKLMASHRVLQYFAGANKKPPTVYLHCHVKPGASKVREGITAVTDSTIELCVSAVPKDGESNKAVLAVLSEVSC
jgi:uncharacterized protein